MSRIEQAVMDALRSAMAEVDVGHGPCVLCVILEQAGIKVMMASGKEVPPALLQRANQLAASAMN